MIAEDQIIIRIAVAAALGLLIGIERERRNQDAGLRTHMILVIGATLAMAVSLNIAMMFYPDAPNGDPARLAAQVVSGIGFLGAGVIFRSGNKVLGLTTAVSLWTMAMVGLAVGAGFFFTGVIVTGILLLILTVLDYIEDHFIPSMDDLHLMVWANDRPEIVDDIKKTLNLGTKNINRVSIERDVENAVVFFDARLRIWKTKSHEGIIKDLSSIQGIRKVKIDL